MPNVPPARQDPTFRRGGAPRVALTVDFEPDCPPYLSSTFRGIEEGAPKLLELFADEQVPATYFTTGEVAERFPDAVRALVAAGHELGCHGVSHTAFDRIDEATARWEIASSVRLLRAFAPVVSFRAPYLRFPERYVRLLEEHDFQLDSSLARYKRSFRTPRAPTSLARVPASMTSSVLRLPAFVRDPWLASLRDPVVLFVHPWEFVDLTREKLRLDCRFRTGDVALRCLREVIASFAARGSRFVTMRELAA
jgi:peptidoglycan/xylan/chitin deacetylase (PgdA/CDA1 family)